MVIAVRVILLVLLGLIAVCVYRGIVGRGTGWLWLAAALLYVVSAPFAMSIGVLTVAGTFALAGAAIGRLLHRGLGGGGAEPLVDGAGAGPRPDGVALAAGALAGLAVWGAWFLLGDITWVFWPLLAPADALLSR